MTITRETLELAALAAGVDATWREWRAARIGAFGALGHAKKSGFMLQGGKEWRPHLDDGDAARLADHLRMYVDSRGTAVQARVVGGDWHRVERDGNPGAWREAVTLCAAAVGERMRGER